MLDCLYTTVRNVNPGSRFYGFLPPHGRRLAAGEELTVFGDLTTRVAHRWGRRLQDSFEKCLKNGLIVLVKTPLVHVFDETVAETKGLALDNGVLGTVDPCWGAYESSAVA